MPFFTWKTAGIYHHYYCCCAYCYVMQSRQLWNLCFNYGIYESYDNCQTWDAKLYHSSVEQFFPTFLLSIFKVFVSFRIRIEQVLLKSNVLSEVQRSMVDGGMRVEDLPVDPGLRSGSASPHLGQPRPTTEHPENIREAFFGTGGPAGLWHFMYRSIFLDQYVSSEFSSPINTAKQQKRWKCKFNLHCLKVTFPVSSPLDFVLPICRLYRAYQKLYSSMHDKVIGPHRTQFRRDENYGNVIAAFFFNMFNEYFMAEIFSIKYDYMKPVLSFYGSDFYLLCHSSSLLGYTGFWALRGIWSSCR